MSLKVDKVQLEIIMKADSARAELIKLEDQSISLTKELTKVKKQFGENSTEYKDAQLKLEGVKKRMTELKGGIGITGMTMRELQQRSKELNLQLRNIDPRTEKFKEYKTELNDVNNRLKDLRLSANGTKTGFSGFSKQLESIPGPVGNVIQGIKGFGSALKALLLNPVGLLIAAIVGGLMLMYKAFMSTDEGANMFNGVMKAMSNIMDVVLDRVVSYIKLIGSILTLDMEGIKKNGKEAFGGIAESIKDAATAGYNYVQIMDAIDDREQASLIRSAKLRTEIEKLKNEAKNQNLPIQERIRLNDLAMKKEKELLAIEKGFMKEKLDAEITNVASLINVQGMTIKQKEQQIREWLKLDDRQILQYAENHQRFKDFYDKNEEAFKSLQKLKAEEYDRDSEFEQNTRRLQKESFSFKKELQQQENENRNKQLKKQQEIYDKEIKDLETKAKIYEENHKKLTISVAEQIMENEIAILDKKLKYGKITEDEYVLYKTQAGNKYLENLTNITNKEIEVLKKAAESGKAALQESIDADIASGDESVEKMKQQQEQRKQNYSDFLNNNIEATNNSVNAQLNLLQYQMQQELSVKELTESQKNAIVLKYANIERNIRETNLTSQLSLVSSFIGNTSKLFKQGTKEQKALSTSQIAIEGVISGFQAFNTAAYKSGIPIPYNYIAGGLAAAGVAAATGAAIADVWAVDENGSGPVTPTAHETGKRIAVPQASDGRYDVVGAQDRKLYQNVRYMGRARTGMVTTPTLYGEAGTELVIDAPTLRNLNMRAPDFIPFVMAHRVRQRADGNYAPAGAVSPTGSQTDYSGMFAAIYSVISKNNELLDYLKTNGIEAFMLYDKFQKEYKLYQDSINKGSK